MRFIEIWESTFVIRAVYILPQKYSPQCRGICRVREPSKCGPIRDDNNNNVVKFIKLIPRSRIVLGSAPKTVFGSKTWRNQKSGELYLIKSMTHIKIIIIENYMK